MIDTPIGRCRNRHELDALRNELAAENRTYPDTMREIPIPGAWAPWQTDRAPRRAWRSRRFLGLIQTTAGAIRLTEAAYR